ncbi:MAG: thymidylate kinase [Escherichia coli]|nr:thymidylate kinase [Escherichia coli]
MQSITPPLIAVIGSDGSGKSTVCEHLITVVEKYGAAERVHLGKQAGNVGRAVTKLPLMGKSLHKTIERNQVKTAGTVFPPNVEGGRFVSWLASQERKAFHWMASHKPDLVIKLNVDLDVACARKPDHKRESLERKIAITPQLTFGGAQLVDIDANQPLEQVLVDAEKAITDFMTARGYH